MPRLGCGWEARTIGISTRVEPPFESNRQSNGAKVASQRLKAKEPAGMDRGVGGTFITRNRIGLPQNDSAPIGWIRIDRTLRRSCRRVRLIRLNRPASLVLALLVGVGLGCGCGLRPGLNRSTPSLGLGPNSPASWNGSAWVVRDVRRHPAPWPRAIVANPAEGLTPPPHLVAATRPNPLGHAAFADHHGSTTLQENSSRPPTLTPAIPVATPASHPFNPPTTDDPLPPPLPFPFVATNAPPSTVLVGQTVTRHDLTARIRQSDAERRLLEPNDDDHLRVVSFEPVPTSETPPQVTAPAPVSPTPPASPETARQRSQSRPTTPAQPARGPGQQRRATPTTPLSPTPATMANPTLTTSTLPDAFQPPRFERAPVLPPLGPTNVLMDFDDAWQRLLGPEAGPFSERWRAGLAALNRLLNERSSTTDDSSSTFPSARRAIHARMISWMREDLQRSSSPPTVSNQEDWIRLALRELDDGFGLRIVRMALCRRVEGFGNYEPIEPARLNAGQTVILYAELMGVRAASEQDAKYHSTLESRLEIVSIAEDRILWSEPLGRAEDSCRLPRLDYYANVPFTPPSSLTSGPYRLRLVLSDLVAGITASSELEFELTAHSSQSPPPIQSQP